MCIRDRGHTEEAVTVLSMVYHHPQAISRIRDQIDAARPRLQADMGVTAFAVAWERDRGLSFEVGLALVRAALLDEAQSLLGEEPRLETQSPGNEQRI